MDLLSDTYFGGEGPFKRNVELYGAIPAYGKIHNNAGPLVILTNDTPDYDNIQIDEDDDINLVNAESTIWIQKTKKISTEIKKLLNDKNYLDKILSDGHEKANEIAEKKMKNIRQIVGF